MNSFVSTGVNRTAHPARGRWVTAGKLVVAPLLYALSACVLPQITRIGDDSTADTIDLDAAVEDAIGGESSINQESSVGCPPGLSVCPNVPSCVDLRSDRNHCGMCGNACPASQGQTPVCNSGVCDAVCVAPRRMCGNACVDVRTDIEHCGDCATRCTGAPPNGTATCAESVGCEFTCNPGFTRVGNSCVTTCAADQFCGAGPGNCVAGSGCTSVRKMTVAFNTVGGALGACNTSTYGIAGAVSWLECTSAANRYCRTQGGRWGFGPVQIDGNFADIVCVYAPAPALMAVPQRDITTIDPMCTFASRSSLSCASASVGWCNRMTAGHSGWGPVEGDASNFAAGCVPPSIHSIINVPAGVLMMGNPSGQQCQPETAARSLACDQAAHRICAADRRFVSGVGPITGSAGTGYDLLCLRGRAVLPM